MKLSVLMSVYRESLFLLEKAINSIFSQTFNDFEFVIILDDPSNFNAESYLRDLSKKHMNVKIIVNSVNIGLTKSLNLGLHHCCGEFIARMDADDVSMPDRFEKQVNFLNENTEIVACGSYFKYIDVDGNEIGRVKLRITPKDIFDNIFFMSPFCHPSVMFRRIVDGKEVHYDESLKYSQDYGLWARLVIHHKMAVIPEYLFCYRISSSQITSKNHSEQQQCHVRTQKQLICDLKILITEKQADILLNILNERSLKYTNEDIERSLICFIYNNKSNDKVNVSLFRYTILSNYSNYLPMYYPLYISLWRFFRMSFGLKKISSRCLVSMMNKYRVK